MGVIQGPLANPLPVQSGNLMARMLNKEPLVGYNLWFDTADTSYIYIMEAPLGVTAGQTGFQGIRVTLAGGNPVGEVQQNTGATLTFTNRVADGGWA